MIKYFHQVFFNQVTKYNSDMFSVILNSMIKCFLNINISKSDNHPSWNKKDETVSILFKSKLREPFITEFPLLSCIPLVTPHVYDPLSVKDTFSITNWICCCVSFASNIRLRYLPSAVWLHSRKSYDLGLPCVVGLNKNVTDVPSSSRLLVGKRVREKVGGSDETKQNLSSTC